MTRADNSHHLRRAAAARHNAAVCRGRAAIEELDRSGGSLTFSSVARAAGVSRGWLYTQADLREVIIELRRDGSEVARTTIPVAQRATLESLRQRLNAAREDISRLRTENFALREQLGRALGERRVQH
ncbi:MAG: transposase [Acidimicrobiaceae bacterium]|nr:transposase [Acidimicrobiaceae bacterium]